MQELMKEKERMRHQVNDLVLPPSSSPPAGEREREKNNHKKTRSLTHGVDLSVTLLGSHILSTAHTHTGCAIIIGREKDEEKTTGGGTKL